MNDPVSVFVFLFHMISYDVSIMKIYVNIKSHCVFAMQRIQGLHKSHGDGLVMTVLSQGFMLCYSEAMQSIIGGLVTGRIIMGQHTK